MGMELLKDLRGLQVEVIHPKDDEGEDLVQHLKRIGCRVSASWPPPKSFSKDCDLVFLAMEQGRRDELLRLIRRKHENAPTLIAVVDYENPTALQLLLESDAMAVVEKPVRPFGVLTNLVIARSLRMRLAQADEKVGKLERKLSGMRKIGKAKSILMQTQGLSEDEAYKNLRQQAMAKRVAMEEIAAAIINAHELLNFRADRD